MKSGIRRRLKQDRLAMSAIDRTARSAAIIKQLKEIINWSDIKNLHYFEPMHGLMEPDIIPFINYLSDNYPQLKLVAANTKTPPSEKFDAIIVPMLGFDRQNLQRIGYGGGYYDKFLATQPLAQKIGVCFELGKLGHLPAEAHDIPLDRIVTEAHKYRVHQG